MREKDAWQVEAKCKKLSPKQADTLFFPGPGGKKNKADSYCATCPVLNECLIDAIENGLKGFIAGTTENERFVMARRWHIQVGSLPLPPEPVKKKPVYRKIVNTIDYWSWMDTAEPDPSVMLR